MNYKTTEKYLTFLAIPPSIGWVTSEDSNCLKFETITMSDKGPRALEVGRNTPWTRRSYAQLPNLRDTEMFAFSEDLLTSSCYLSGSHKKFPALSIVSQTLLFKDVDVPPDTTVDVSTAFMADEATLGFFRELYKTDSLVYMMFCRRVKPTDTPGDTDTSMFVSFDLFLVVLPAKYQEALGGRNIAPLQNSILSEILYNSDANRHSDGAAINNVRKHFPIRLESILFSKDENSSQHLSTLGGGAVFVDEERAPLLTRGIRFTPINVVDDIAGYPAVYRKYSATVPTNIHMSFSDLFVSTPDKSMPIPFQKLYQGCQRVEKLTGACSSCGMPTPLLEAISLGDEKYINIPIASSSVTYKTCLSTLIADAAAFGEIDSTSAEFCDSVLQKVSTLDAVLPGALYLTEQRNSWIPGSTSGLLKASQILCNVGDTYAQYDSTKVGVNYKIPPVTYPGTAYNVDYTFSVDHSPSMLFARATRLLAKARGDGGITLPPKRTFGTNDSVTFFARIDDLSLFLAPYARGANSSGGPIPVGLTLAARVTEYKKRLLDTKNTRAFVKNECSQCDWSDYCAKNHYSRDSRAQLTSKKQEQCTQAKKNEEFLPKINSVIMDYLYYGVEETKLRPTVDYDGWLTYKGVRGINYKKAVENMRQDLIRLSVFGSQKFTNTLAGNKFLHKSLPVFGYEFPLTSPVHYKDSRNYYMRPSVLNCDFLLPKGKVFNPSKHNLVAELPYASPRTYYCSQPLDSMALGGVLTSEGFPLIEGMSIRNSRHAKLRRKLRVLALYAQFVVDDQERKHGALHKRVVASGFNTPANGLPVENARHQEVCASMLRAIIVSMVRNAPLPRLADFIQLDSKFSDEDYRFFITEIVNTTTEAGADAFIPGSIPAVVALLSTKSPRWEKLQELCPWYFSVRKGCELRSTNVLMGRECLHGEDFIPSRDTLTISADVVRDMIDTEFPSVKSKYVNTPDRDIERMWFMAAFVLSTNTPQGAYGFMWEKFKHEFPYAIQPDVDFHEVPDMSHVIDALAIHKFRGKRRGLSESMPNKFKSMDSILRDGTARIANGVGPLYINAGYSYGWGYGLVRRAHHAYVYPDMTDSGRCQLVDISTMRIHLNIFGRTSDGLCVNGYSSSADMTGTQLCLMNINRRN